MTPTARAAGDGALGLSGLGLPRARGPMVLAGEQFGPSRLWRLLFVSRHAAITLLAVVSATLDEFGDDRFVIAAVLLFAVLPYDIGVHLYARRHLRLPISMPFIYAVVPAGLVIAFPAAWLPALLAAVANLVLFAITFEIRIALTSAALSTVAFGVAAAVGDPVMPWAGALTFAIVCPALVIGTGALLATLNQSEETYRDYIEKATDIIYVHDLDGTFISANETALRVTGYTAAEFGKINATDIVAPEYLDEALARIERAVARGSSESDTTPWGLEIVTRDGDRIPVEVNTRLIVQRGRPIGIQGIARDISERKQVEAQQAALDRARSEFIANAAHELRTPLTTLAGLAAVLASKQEETSPQDLREGLLALARQGRRAQHLADRLLDLSILELGGMSVRAERVGVADVIDQARETVAPPPDRRVLVAVEAGLVALADAVHLQEVISNLLGNAIRYGGPAIEISARRAGDQVEIMVSDNGTGVPDDLVPRLFEPFTRGDQEGGTGLGLAICARLCRALQGTIEYSHRPDGGARFGVTLPAARPANSRPTPDSGH